MVSSPSLSLSQYLMLFFFNKILSGNKISFEVQAIKDLFSDLSHSPKTKINGCFSVHGISIVP